MSYILKKNWDGSESLTECGPYATNPLSTEEPSVASEWTLVDIAEASASPSLDLAVNANDYDEWLLVGEDVVLSGALELALRVGTGAGPTIDTAANYDWRGRWEYGTSGTGTTSGAYVSATSNFRLGTVGSASSPSGKPMRIETYIYGLADGDNARLYRGEADYDGSAGLTNVRFTGIHNQTTEITGFQIYTAQTVNGTTASGSITSGKFLLYGRTRQG